MKMTNMEMSKKEKKEMNAPCAVGASISGPDYPYGLRIELSDKALEKLGIDKLPKTGGVVTVHAKAQVTSTEERTEGGKSRKSMSLQITDLAIEDDESYEAGFDEASEKEA